MALNRSEYCVLAPILEQTQTPRPRYVSANYHHLARVRILRDGYLVVRILIPVRIVND